MAAPPIWPRGSSASSSLASFPPPLPVCSCLWSPSWLLRSVEGCIGSCFVSAFDCSRLPVRLVKM
ncbi:hypothetical protein EJB05_15949, partial [Eragrostis curvula]